jgi:hypothetical protein
MALAHLLNFSAGGVAHAASALHSKRRTPMAKQLTKARRCRCCGAEVGHGGWLDVCDNPACVRKGMREHARKKHLQIFPVGPGYYVTFVCDIDPDPDRRSIIAQPVYFGTEAEAKKFVARVRAGIPKGELTALVEAHGIPEHDRQGRRVS